MMFFVPAYPFWALAIIAMNVVALYGLPASPPLWAASVDLKASSR